MESLIFFLKSSLFHIELFVFSDNRVISDIVSFDLFHQSYDIVLSLLQITLHGLFLKIQVSDLLFQQIFFLLDDAYLSI
jgi:pyoverdine/dityrosine biosynthesis protein Dit1